MPIQLLQRASFDSPDISEFSHVALGIIAVLLFIDLPIGENNLKAEES